MGFLERWRCFHHDRSSRKSWIKDELIDLGRSKRFWCTRCGKIWML